MILGERGKALIHEYEQCRLEAYKPTPADRWTIGWGHTRGVDAGLTCIQQQADAWFDEDVVGAEQAVNSVGVPLTQAMFDALVSLCYNAGPSPVAKGKTIGNALRARDYHAAQRGFALWNKQGGTELRGLTRRRAQEAELFMEDGLP